MCVFFHVHLFEIVQNYTNNPFILAVIRVCSAGGWGVTFFFVLSGFLITWLLLIEVENLGKIDIKAFYKRRIFRIWPLYYTTIIIGYILLPLLYKTVSKPLIFDYPFLYYGTFLSNFGVINLDPSIDRSYPLIMNISWSVSIEEQFYLVWPLFFLLIKQPNKFIWAPICLLIVSLFTAFIYRNNLSVLYSSTFSRIGDLSIGAFFAILLFQHNKILESIINLKRRFIFIVYILSAGLIYSSFFVHAAIEKYAINFFGAVLFGIIIVEQNFSKNSFFKFGRLTFASYLGKISYGLYMLHPIAMFAASIILQFIFKQNSSVNSGYIYIITSLLLAIAMAWASYNILEKPFLRLKNRFSKI